MSVSLASKTKGPERDVSARVPMLFFSNVAVTEAELSVIFGYTTIVPLWLLYRLIFFIIAAVALGHV